MVLAGDGLAGAVDGAARKPFVDAGRQAKTAVVGVDLAAEFRPAAGHRDGVVEVESDGSEQCLGLQPLAAALQALGVGARRRVECPLGNDGPRSRSSILMSSRTVASSPGR